MLIPLNIYVILSISCCSNVLHSKWSTSSTCATKPDNRFFKVIYIFWTRLHARFSRNLTWKEVIRLKQFIILYYFYLNVCCSQTWGQVVVKTCPRGTNQWSSTPCHHVLKFRRTQVSNHLYVMTITGTVTPTTYRFTSILNCSSLRRELLYFKLLSKFKTFVFFLCI